MIFKCKHPADKLHVKKYHTTRKSDEDFDIITYHLYCMKCNEPIDISFAHVRDMDKFFTLKKWEE